MKTRDLIILEIAAGQRERNPRTLREIAAELDIPFNIVKDRFAAYSGFAPNQRLHNGGLVTWRCGAFRTLLLKNAVIINEGGSVRVGRWEAVE